MKTLEEIFKITSNEKEVWFKNTDMELSDLKADILIKHHDMMDTHLGLFPRYINMCPSENMMSAFLINKYIDNIGLAIAKKQMSKKEIMDCLSIISSLINEFE